MTPREYTLLLTRSQKLQLWLPLVLLTVLVPGAIFFIFRTSAASASADVPPFFPFLPIGFVLLVAALFTWSVLTLPRQISVTRDRRLIFRSILRSQSVKVSDVLSIEPQSLNIQTALSGYVLTHREGKIRFPGQFTGQYLLLHELKEANPAVELKGC